jgi:hypothetical protein
LLRLDRKDTVLAGDAACPAQRLALAGGHCGCESGTFESIDTQRCEPCTTARTTSTDGGIGRASCDARCKDGYVRLPSESNPSSVAGCTLCSDFMGVTCASDATIGTINLTRGYWRHSATTVTTYRCEVSGEWSPCFGGGNVGLKGDGYCVTGYRGPRCEICDGPTYSRYFDKLGARCHDCGDITARGIAAFSVVLFLFLVASGVWTVLAQGLDKGPGKGLGSRQSARWLKRFRTLRALRSMNETWREVNMQFKLKAESFRGLVPMHRRRSKCV